ncbi:carbamoyltransferase HypF [Nocardia carnea]|uniref:carbamoyltransferase HypF n=1 Tax=Nocardia carnea TaxID=37328 RepID=UPI00245704A3|nr:carbamoyltransferase HypF [Nocardia carnea]
MTAERRRRRLRVRGVVQGVGFRPFVYTTATELALAGEVGNDEAGVLVEVEGSAAALDAFAERLRRPPPAATVESVECTDLAARDDTGFRIADSARTGGRTAVPPDAALCATCTGELRDPGNRRYRHPFINCTDCGPRFTITTGLPFDRERTSMAEFALCDSCAREYADPTDRRFHAQSICCPGCGPVLTFSGTGAGDALSDARALLRAGGILAVKGIGGYHLACDATDQAAVSELRRQKDRGDKPFAVMVPDLTTARRIVRVDRASAALLTGAAHPIVLLPRRGHAGDDSTSSAAADLDVAQAVAPASPDLGVMLPYTAVHLLLFGLPGDPSGPRALVMTSGNRGGEPICYDDEDARTRLAGLADARLSHNRRILVPCDDSVLRVVDGVELPIRRSRGYVPAPMVLPMPVPPTLAVGGDVKNTCAVADGRTVWLSQHLGDMDRPATLAAFDTAERHLERLTRVTPGRLVADAHPGYRSTGWARRHAGEREVRTVQHHHAHIAAVMGEHGLDPSETVLGFAFDGTGWGPDGAIWGGELLAAGYRGFRRLAHLKYVPLPGGDITVERPYRMALAHLWAAGVGWPEHLAPVQACPHTERGVLEHQLRTGLGCAPTSSMGRLFDAVASLAGIRHTVDYEAQAAIELEAAARDTSTGKPVYRFAAVPGTDPVVIDPAPVITAVAQDTGRTVPTGVIGARFHAAVARLVAELALDHGEIARTVVLSGGVFQNALLLSATRTLLRDHGFTVLCPHRLPPNDGGLALGQVLAAGAG